MSTATMTGPGLLISKVAVARSEALDWDRISGDLDARGSAVLDRLLTAKQCEALAGLYPEDGLFRSRVVMGRHGFGRGEYKYFHYPLPELIADLRTALYPRLAPIANRWNIAMGIEVQYPASHADFIARCHSAGQRKPTPLLLNTGRTTSTACTRTCTANTSFRCRWPFSCPSRGATSPVESSCSPSNALGCSLARKSCRCSRAMRWPSPCITGRSGERGGCIGSICDTASAAFAQDAAIRSASFFMTRNDEDRDS